MNKLILFSAVFMVTGSIFAADNNWDIKLHNGNSLQKVKLIQIKEDSLQVFIANDARTAILEDKL